MNTYQLTENESSILQYIIVNEINDLATTDIEFYNDLIKQEISIKDYIDERIMLAEKFGLDFWATIKVYSSHYFLQRLLYLYEGKSMREFMETYEFSESQSQIDFLQGISKLRC